MITVLALLANIALSWSHFRGPTGWTCDPLSVLLILIALLLLLAGSAVIWPARIERTAVRLTPPLLGVLVVIRLIAFAPCFMIESLDGGCPALLAWVLLLGAAMALGSYRLRFLPPRARLPILLAVATAGQFSLIRSQPELKADVLVFQQEASRALLSGHNPYAASYTNVHSENVDRVYGPGLVRDGRVTFFPYPPLSLLTVLPGHFLGDIRYANLAALAGSCILLAATGGALGVPAGSTYELITVALVLQLDSQIVIGIGWTEPLLLLGVTAAGYAFATGRRLLLGLALAFIVAIKQYGILWTIPLLATGQLGWKDLALAGAAVLAVNAPFFLWGPRDFWDDLIVAQVVAPFRPDLSSVPALVFAWSGRKMSFAWSIAATLAAAAIAVRRRPVPAPRAIMGGTAIVLAFVAFSKQGAQNYLWFTSAAPLVAAVLDSCKRRSAGVSSLPSDGAKPDASQFNLL